jgi:hypothetical protein
MRICILGAGNVGQRLGRLARAAGHDVIFGVRPGSQADGFDSADVPSSIAGADIVALAIPFTACSEFLPALEPHLSGKIVVDVTNPLHADWSPMLLGDVSAAQTIAALVPGARVVKAFNTVFADIMTPEGLDRRGFRVTAFIAGDDEPARDVVRSFADSMGFEPVVVGPLHLARFLEGMAHLNIAIALGQSGGTNAAFLYDHARA